MNRKSFLLIALCCVPFCGCDEYEYTIRMEPDGDRINRQIVCSENVTDDIRKRLGNLYDKQIDKNIFKGSFGQTLPKDVGGYGSYVYLNNLMGSTYIYVERLRGKDTQAPEMEEAFNNADRLVDLLIDWLRMELGENPNFDKLRKFCDGTLREDLKNLSLYSWVGTRASDEANEAFIRISLYLYERGYFTLDDVGRFSTSTNKEEFALSYFRRLVADKLEFQKSEETEGELRFLQDPNALEASLIRFTESAALRERLTAEAREQTGDPDLVLDPCDVRSALEDVPKEFFDMFFVELFGPSADKVNVRLVCPAAPYETNGQWNDRTGEVSWSDRTRMDELPFLCYAAIGQANNAYQQEHFGKVVLQDDRLVQYSLWYKGLGSEKRNEWDDFIAGLDGGEDVWGKVEAFRFKDAIPSSADSEAAGELLSDLPRNLISERLKAKEGESRGSKGPESAVVQDRSFTVYPIGKVLKKDGRSLIVLDEQYRAGLKGLQQHSYVTVVYWFDKNDTPQKRAILEVHPRADKSNPLTGVFATHSPFRPNLIAISKCDIIEIRENVIEVKDIDAFDGTPVLDLKGDFFRFHRPGTE
ncbi:MAG: SAM-dependent methyltransferase [Phycisphaerales bacterium]|nr:MAG: SAM-dependent methyltransferase [Phycisphaerales bacterium]